MTLAEPEGYVRVFIDEGPPMAALLRALAKQGTAGTWPSSSVRLTRHGRGWQGSRPSSRISDRTSSGPAGHAPGRQVRVHPAVPVRVIRIPE